MFGVSRWGHFLLQAFPAGSANPAADALPLFCKGIPGFVSLQIFAACTADPATDPFPPQRRVSYKITHNVL